MNYWKMDGPTNQLVHHLCIAKQEESLVIKTTVFALQVLSYFDLNLKFHLWVFRKRFSLFWLLTFNFVRHSLILVKKYFHPARKTWMTLLEKLIITFLWPWLEFSIWLWKKFSFGHKPSKNCYFLSWHQHPFQCPFCE